MRFLGRVTGFAVCLVLLVAALAPVQASDAVGSAAGSRDLPRREMNDKVLRNGKGWLILKGNVDPGWKRKNVQIYKRLCQGCEWTIVKKTRTDGSGRWRTRIYAPETG